MLFVRTFIFDLPLKVANEKFIFFWRDDRQFYAEMFTVGSKNRRHVEFLTVLSALRELRVFQERFSLDVRISIA